MRWLRLLILACFLSNVCEAAITVDTTTEKTTACNSSFAITTSAGSNAALVVAISDNGATLNSVTDDNGFLTRAGTTSGATYKTYIYYSTGAVAGVHNITITYASCTSIAAYAAAYSLFGVDQTNPLDVYGGASGSTANPSKAVTVTNNNGFETDIIEVFQATVADNTPHTALVYDSVAKSTAFGSSGYVTGVSAGTFTSKWTYTNGTRIWTLAVAVWKAAAGAAAPAASAPFFGAEM